jgi:hypothetical protein
MNTAARMESNSIRGRILITEETANLIIENGRSDWLTPRKDVVMAKGKGAMTTFWLDVGQDARNPISGSEDSLTGSIHDDSSQSASAELRMRKRISEEAFKLADDKKQRLIGWQLETMVRLLKQVVANRKASNKTAVNVIRIRGNTPMDEVVEVIKLPKIVRNVSKFASTINLEEGVIAELRDYISSIANIYQEVSQLIVEICTIYNFVREVVVYSNGFRCQSRSSQNPFHNFEVCPILCRKRNVVSRNI